jgi:hypothetical protein
MTVGRLSVACLVAACALACAVSAPATPAGQICPAFSKYNHTYRWSTAGTAFSCASAKRYLLRILATPVPRGAGAVVKLKNGPAGYHCQTSVWDSRRRITGGVCYKHTLAFPGSGFQWFAL